MSMIAPESIYEECKGKSKEEILSTIRSLKREISRQKRVAEDPDNQIRIHPSPEVIISVTRDYIEAAKRAYAEVGGVYVPTKAELAAEKFDQNIEHIRKITFQQYAYMSFSDCKDCELEIAGDDVKITKSNGAHQSEPVDLETDYYGLVKREDLYEIIRDLHMGEWLHHYDLKRFGYEILDGTHWDLTIEYDNGIRKATYSGENDYPWNFDELLEHCFGYYNFQR